MAMKAMVVYDSQFGNTEQVARAIGQALAATAEVEVLRVRDASPEQLVAADLLVVGSPTQRFTATPATTNLLKSIANDGLRGIQVAAFDTRFPESEIDRVRILAFFVKLFGYAAEPILKRLEKKGGEAVAAPEGFYVSETEGPLLDGELERAAAWAGQIAGAP
jgi:flavodoxin